MTEPIVWIKKGRDRSLRRRHRWVFSGAVARIDGDPESGSVVRVSDSAGGFLAWGYFNPDALVQVRVLDWREQARIDDEWWRERIRQAVDRRASLPSLGETNAWRCVHADGDGLPGLIADRYASVVVLQALTRGVERVKQVIVETVVDCLSPLTVYERSDGESRRLEGLDDRRGVLYGPPLQGAVEVEEAGLRFAVDVIAGHKTGFYLDQRENRVAVRRYASGRRVLDLFSYSGAFAAHALRAGAASVDMVESSADAIATARRNMEINGFGEPSYRVLEGNVFSVVRSLRDAGEVYDMVIVDPPKLAPTRSQLRKAERAYKDVNLLAMKLLRPGGILASFSCSGAVTASELARVLGWAAIDAGRQVSILETLGQAGDHPVDPLTPESGYLNGFVCRID